MNDNCWEAKSGTISILEIEAYVRPLFEPHQEKEMQALLKLVTTVPMGSVQGRVVVREILASRKS